MFSLLRGSGLKLFALIKSELAQIVLPLTREWIEILLIFYKIITIKVLPLTREWIEIPILDG